MNLVLVRKGTQVIVPFILVVALGLLVRGHDAPGGGFVAGLMISAAWTLYRFAFGAEEVERILPVRAMTLAGTGLLIAAGSFLPGMLMGGAAGLGVWGAVDLGVLGKPKIGTPVVFDIGVCLIVVGTVVGILERGGRDE